MTEPEKHSSGRKFLWWVIGTIASTVLTAFFADLFFTPQIMNRYVKPFFGYQEPAPEQLVSDDMRHKLDQISVQIDKLSHPVAPPSAPAGGTATPVSPLPQIPPASAGHDGQAAVQREVPKPLPEAPSQPLAKPAQPDADADRSKKIFGVFLGQAFDLCGMNGFKARFTQISPKQQGVILQGNDPKIPGISFRGYEKVLPLDSPSELWTGCNATFGHDVVEGMERIAILTIQKGNP